MSPVRSKATSKGAAARAWREKVKLSPQDLADRSGYSLEAVYQFARGKRSDGSEHSEWAWQRFRLCCAAVEHQLRTGKEFSW